MRDTGRTTLGVGKDRGLRRYPRLGLKSAGFTYQRGWAVVQAASASGAYCPLGHFILPHSDRIRLSNAGVTVGIEPSFGGSQPPVLPLHYRQHNMVKGEGFEPPAILGGR